MRGIDEAGRLFGRVNVYDALVVVVLLGAVGAGVVVLDPFADRPGEPATRYATVELGPTAPAVAERIDAGDEMHTGVAGHNLTVTDTYVGPSTDGNVSVVLRVRLNGTAVEGDDGQRVFEFGAGPLRRGDDLAIETAGYGVEGGVLAVESGGTSLQTGQMSVLVEAQVTSATTALIDRGDAYRLDGDTVATVTSATVVSAGQTTNATALLGLSLQTVRHSGTTHFGDTPVRVGRTVEFATDRYALSGTVTRWGNASLPGEPVNRTVVVRVENVRPDVADGFRTGMVERRDGTVIAAVTDVRTEPASVVLTSDSGNIYERDHPRNRDVSLTVDLRVRRTDDGLQFRTRPLREGTTILLDFRDITANGTVVDIAG